MPERKCDPVFNGTFLQSEMSCKWDSERWAKEVAVMQQDGIEYLILQDIANMDASGNWVCYYDSNVAALKNAKIPADVVKDALEACKDSDIKVFIGLSMYDNFWTTSTLSSEYSRVCAVAADMIADIYGKYKSAYPDTLYGWYFTPEINNIVNCSVLFDRAIAGFNTVLDKAHQTDASMPVLLSPFTSNYLSLGKINALTLWVKLFKQAHFNDGDIVAPQDAVGAAWIDEEDLQTVWEMYSIAASYCKADIELWGNCENFDLAIAPSALNGLLTRPTSENVESVTATLDRFTRQMDIASRYCDNIITFSYNHYFSPEYVKGFYMETYHDYINNGFVLENECPTAPESFTKTQSDSGTVLTWEPSHDNFGIAYYRILKNGEFFTRVEMYKLDCALSVIDESGKAKDVYTIVACDAAGNYSDSVSA